MCGREGVPVKYSKLPAIVYVFQPQVQILTFFIADLEVVFQGGKALLAGFQTILSGLHQIVVTEARRQQSSGNHQIFRHRRYGYDHLPRREYKPGAGAQQDQHDSKQAACQPF